MNKDEKFKKMNKDEKDEKRRNKDELYKNL